MIHQIRRNGRLYDSLNPETHDVMQHVRSLANDHHGDNWQAVDENGQIYFETQVNITTLDDDGTRTGHKAMKSAVAHSLKTLNDW